MLEQLLQPNIFKIYSGCIILLLFVIYYKNDKNTFPKDGIITMRSGIVTKSTLKSNNHWEYAQKFGINLGFKLILLFIGICTIFNVLYVFDLITYNTYFVSSFLIEVLPIITFYSILDYKVKNLSIA